MSSLSQLYRKWLATTDCLPRHRTSELREWSTEDASSTLKDPRSPLCVVYMLELELFIRILVVQKTRQTFEAIKRDGRNPYPNLAVTAEISRQVGSKSGLSQPPYPRMWPGRFLLPIDIVIEPRLCCAHGANLIGSTVSCIVIHLRGTRFALATDAARRHPQETS